MVCVMLTLGLVVGGASVRGSVVVLSPFERVAVTWVLLWAKVVVILVVLTQRMLDLVQRSWKWFIDLNASGTRYGLATVVLR